MLKFDTVHNKNILTNIMGEIDEFYKLSEMLAQFVVKSEYGLTSEIKLETAKIVNPLCEKIKRDLAWCKKFCV